MNLHLPHAMLGIGLFVSGVAFAQIPTPPLTDPSGAGLRAPSSVTAAAPERVAVARVPSAEPQPVAALVARPSSRTTGFDDAAPRGGDTIASRPAYRPAPIGNATRNLLRQQVAGHQAGNALPVLGASATLSQQRYLDSFKYPIPERFESRVSGKTSGSN